MQEKYNNTKYQQKTRKATCIGGKTPNQIRIQLKGIFFNTIHILQGIGLYYKEKIYMAYELSRYALIYFELKYGMFIDYHLFCCCMNRY